MRDVGSHIVRWLLWARMLERRLVLLPSKGREMPKNPTRTTSAKHTLTGIALAMRGEKVSHTAVCLSAASACGTIMAFAGLSGHPGLAVAFLFGVSLIGFVCFLMDIRA